MEIISVKGIILNSTPYKESSKILNILTSEYGVIGVISKGCKGPKSKLRAVSENFTYAVFHLYYRNNGLSTLIGGDIQNYFLKLKSNIILVGYLTYLCDLTKNVAKQSYENDILDLLISSLEKINEGFDPLVITNILELKYLDYLGVSINLDSCVVCGSPSIITISYEKGGYICSKCRTNEKVLDEKVLKMLKLYYYVDISKISKLDIKKEIIDEINRFISIYYERYTGLYIKSKSFLEKIKTEI